MRSKMFFLTALVALALSIVPVQAQVQSTDEIVTPTPQFQDQGGVTPWFWIGLQTVFSAGYNIETTAGGFRNYGGDNYTYASFNLAFVDSHYQVPKFYEVPREIDPDAWSGHFLMLNFTSRINSWEKGATGVENNAPAWLAEITGKGMRIGFFTQAAILAGGINDPERTDATSPNPISRISGGNKVLYLKDNQLGTLFYEKSNDSVTSTTYSTQKDAGAIWYTGYEKKELWNVYLTMLSEGNVNSDVRDGKNKGFGGVIDFNVTPFGTFADSETPLTFGISGNVITGFNWLKTTENIGFGLKADSGVWLMDNFVLSPVLAFDGKIDANNKFFWKAGGGLSFRFSGMRWMNDEWGDLFQVDRNAANFSDLRYENNQILKYAYAQVYGATVADPKGQNNIDLNMLFRVEEPDGNAGFHDRLGLMAEMRLYNLLKNELDRSGKHRETKWEAQGRVSWDFNIKQHIITPYLRGYINDDSVLKVRAGAYANFIPFTGFELAYTSANLNKGVTLRKPSYLNGSYKNYFDAGRIELIVILKSDDIRPQVPKRMSDWNYPSKIQDK